MSCQDAPGEHRPGCRSSPPRLVLSGTHPAHHGNLDALWSTRRPDRSSGAHCCPKTPAAPLTSQISIRNLLPPGLISDCGGGRLVAAGRLSTRLVGGGRGDRPGSRGRGVHHLGGSGTGRCDRPVVAVVRAARAAPPGPHHRRHPPLQPGRPAPAPPDHRTGRRRGQPSRHRQDPGPGTGHPRPTHGQHRPARRQHQAAGRQRQPTRPGTPRAGREPVRRRSPSRHAPTDGHRDQSSRPG